MNFINRLGSWRYAEPLVVFCLLVIFLLISAWNISRSSPLLGYDAPRHLHYIKNIKEGRGIPYFYEDGDIQFAYHPPVFYFFASLLVDKGFGWSSLIGLQYFCLFTTILFVITVYLILLEIEVSQFTRLVSLVLLVFSPTLTIIGIFITNEPLSQFFAALSVLFFIKFLKETAYRNIVISSVLLSLAINTKISHLILGPIFLFFILIFREPWREKMRQVIPLALALATILPFVRLNLYRYGSFFPNPVYGGGGSQIATSNYFTSFDTAVIENPFYPTSSFSSYWSHLYGSVFSDYWGHKRPDLIRFPVVCTRQIFDRKIECGNADGYIILSRLGLVVLALAGLGFIDKVINIRKATLARRFFIACGIGYLGAHIWFVSGHAVLSWGVIKASYIMVSLAVFYYLVANGAKLLFDRSIVLNQTRIDWRYFFYLFMAAYLFSAYRAFVL